MKNSPNRTKEQALAIYLFWLKTGFTQDQIAYYFGIDDRLNVQKYCDQVRNSLKNEFVGKYLGSNSLTRDIWLKKNSYICTELFDLKSDQLALIADGTYLYCEKSQNNSFQRSTYSCQKKGHVNLLWYVQLMVT